MVRLDWVSIEFTIRFREEPASANPEPEMDGEAV